MEEKNQSKARIGARRVSDDERVRDGFAELCADIATCYDHLLNSASSQQTILDFNKLAPLCLSAFEVGSGGRGERPDRINAASVLASEVMFVKDDKLTDGEKSTRLQPQTSVTRAALKIYTSAMEIVSRRLNLEVIGATDSLFCTLELIAKTSVDGDQISSDIAAEWKALQAADITAIADKYFKSDPNFQRHEFITALDETETNRWLIRALSGHGSHLTNAFSHTQGVAPVEGITELAVELEKSYPRVIGSAELLIKCAESLKFNTPTLPLDIKPSTKVCSGGSHSPADLLPLTDRQCVIDWRLIQCSRLILAVGDFSTSASVLTLASLLAHSGVPTVELALDFLCGPRTLFMVGNMPGLVWQRKHYVHDVWLPIQKPTHLLINQIPEDAKIDRDCIISDSARWIRSIPGFSGWPKNDWEVLARFCIACERWRRIDLPPYLCLLASPKFETACLSPASLQRLAMPKSYIAGEIGNLARVFIRQTETPLRNHRLEEITTILNSARDGTALGGQIARAQHILKKLESLNVEPTSVFNFSKDIVQRECSSIIKGRTKGKVSTLATRWSAIYPTLNAYPLDFAFEDLAEEDFIEFTDKVNDHCLNKMRADPSIEDKKYHIGSGKERSVRARDSLQWLLHNLQQDGWEISNEVWASIGGATVHYPRLSASSTLILPSALSQMAKAAKTVFSEQPRLAMSFITKSTVMSRFPMRIGEGSTVPMRCTTDSGEIALCITPFATDKSGHAPRVWPISQDLIDLLKTLSEQQLEINPSGKWLYRFDDRATSEDAIVNQQLGVLLRWATGDESARPHALRGVAYQNILWPSWIEFATQFLTTGKTSFECYAWVHNQPTLIRWTLPAQAMQAAGHGAVDPGLQAYAAAWPLIYSIHLASTLIDSQPSDFWRRRFDIKQNTFNVAKSRKPENQFDRWFQIARGVSFRPQPPLFTPANKSSDDKSGQGQHPTTTQQRSNAFDKSSALKFLALLGMKESEVRAERDANLSHHHCSKISKYLPPNFQIDNARARLKSTIFGRALHADIELVKEDSDIANWVAGLSRSDANDLRAIFNRDGAALKNGKGQLRDPNFWTNLVKHMPSNLCISARFGRGHHLELSEEQQLKAIGPSFVLGDRHRDLGAMPQVMLTLKADVESVDSRRRTSVLKVYLLMLQAIEDYQKDNPDLFFKSSSRRIESNQPEEKINA